LGGRGWSVEGAGPSACARDVGRRGGSGPCAGACCAGGAQGSRGAPARSVWPPRVHGCRRRGGAKEGSAAPTIVADGAGRQQDVPQRRQQPAGNAAGEDACAAGGVKRGGSRGWRAGKGKGCTGTARVARRTQRSYPDDRGDIGGHFLGLIQLLAPVMWRRYRVMLRCFRQLGSKNTCVQVWSHLVDRIWSQRIV
jgi:hypothetical protein